MAITPGYKSSTEATEVEEEYIDKGAVKTPQVNDEIYKRYTDAEAAAKAADKVEWPTHISGQTEQGF